MVRVNLLQHLKATAKKLKVFILSFPKLFAVIMCAFIGIGISALIQYHAMSQLDFICTDPVWQTKTWITWFLSTGLERYCDFYPFQDGPLFRTTIGFAYDFFLALIATAWFILLISMVGLLLCAIYYYRRSGE